MAKIKKNKIKLKKSPDVFTEIRGLGVLIEHVDDKIGMVAEQYGDIKKTLDSHTKMIGRLMVDFATLAQLVRATVL